METIVELLGVTQDEREQALALASRIIAFDDPEFDGQGGTPYEALAEMGDFARCVAYRKRSNPGQDIASELLQVEIDGEKLSDQEFNLFFTLLLTAGTETTRSAAAGGMLTFQGHPELWEQLSADRYSLPGAVEEIIRLVAPIQHFSTNGDLRHRARRTEDSRR